MGTRTVRRALCAAVAVAGIAAGTAACGSSGSGGKDAAGEPSATPSASTTVSSAPATTTPPPVTPSRYTIGRAYRWSDPGGATGTTTVLAYDQPVLRDDPPTTDLGVPPGSTWGRLDVKVCLTSGPSISVSQDPWHMQFSDGSQADNTGLSGGDFPKPEFPQDRTVVAGGCARGGIMFPIPKGQRPVEVAYSPDSIPTPTYWTIPAK